MHNKLKFLINHYYRQTHIRKKYNFDEDGED